MIWISSESVFEYFHIAMMALGPISFFGKRQCGYHLKAFFEYFYRVHSQGLGYCQMDHFLHLTSHLQCSLLLSAVLPCLVSCVPYHLVQLNFLHFMSILTDFWNFSHLRFKKYFAIISCLLVFGIMIQVWEINMLQDSVWCQFQWDICWIIFRFKFLKRKLIM